MTSAQSLYAELIHLTKQHLQQEYKPAERLATDTETYLHFRQHFIQSQTKKAAPIQVAAAAPSPSPTPSATPLAPPTVVQKLPPKRIPLPGATPLAESMAPPAPKSAPAEPSQGFTLDIPSIQKQETFGELRKIAQEKLPNFAFIEPIPDDAEARRLARGWEQKKIAPEVIILAFNEDNGALLFLHNLSRTLALYGIGNKVVKASQIIEKSSWTALLAAEGIKLLIGQGKAMEAVPELLNNHAIPCIKLEDTSTYLSNPVLKKALWDSIVQIRS